MLTARDVGALIVDEYGERDKLQLMKLVYYVQAWSLTWDGRPAFDGKIAAWRLGPVPEDLYDAVGGRHNPNQVTSVPGGNGASVGKRVRLIVASIMECFQGLSGSDLIEETHRFSAWVVARGGLPEGARSNQEITFEAMRASHSRQIREGFGRVPVPPTSHFEVADNDSFMSALNRQKANWRGTERRLAVR